MYNYSQSKLHQIILMRIFNYHRYKLIVVLLFTTYFLVSCGATSDGNSLCFFPLCPSPDDSPYHSNPIVESVNRGSSSQREGRFVSIGSATQADANESIVVKKVGSGDTPKLQYGSEELSGGKSMSSLSNGFEGLALESEINSDETNIRAVVYYKNIKLPAAKNPDYLSFGMWQTESPASVVKVFARGDNPFANNKLAPLTGNATYSGKATGLYAW